MTTETLTLSDFLLARIAEDEAVALAASPGGWQYGDVDSVAGGTLYDETRTIAGVHYEQLRDHDGSIVRHMLTHEADANGAHIARHDPARVLATCKAHRAIVELHEAWPVLVETEPAFESADAGDINSMTFRMSKQIQWQTEQQYRERFGSEPPTSPMLRALAQVYGDHPDFNPEWGDGAALDDSAEAVVEGDDCTCGTGINCSQHTIPYY